MESVRELVFFSPRRPPKMHDWSSAFFPARKVGAEAVTLHLESVCSRYCGSPRCSGRLVPGKAWSHREVPEGGQEDESLQVTPCALLRPLYRPDWTSEGPLWAAGLSRAEVPVSCLQAFSVSEECLVFVPVYSHVVLRPQPGYMTKVPTTPFRDQVVNLQALPSEEADPALALLCPLRALRIYVDRTQSIRSSEQLFFCHGGQQKGKAVSKQRLAHWIVEAVALAYQSQGEPCPLGLRAHSTRSVASSHALVHGGRHLQSCGLGDTEHLRKILQSLRRASFFPFVG